MSEKSLDMSLFEFAEGNSSVGNAEGYGCFRARVCGLSFSIPSED